MMDPASPSSAHPAGTLPGTLLWSPAHRDPTDSVRHLLFATRLGRFFWGVVLARVAVGWMHRRWAGAPLSDLITTTAGLLLGVTLVLIAYRLAGIARRRLLWPVRRKLILSYVFIGVVPVVLVIALVLFASAVLFLHVSAFLFRRGFDDVVEDAGVAAETAVFEVQHTGARDPMAVLERRVADLTNRFPGISAAFATREGAARVGGLRFAAAGPWNHVNPPTTLPDWLATSDFGGLLALAVPGESDPRLVARAVRFPDDADRGYAVIVDIPIGTTVQRQVRETTGITLMSIGDVALSDSARPAPGRDQPPDAPAPVERAGDDSWVLNSVTFFDFVDWSTGQRGTLTLAIRVAVGDVYERLAAAQSHFGRFSLSQIFLLFLVVVASLFLLIEIAALLMGFALARSITGSIHGLFDGTRRVRRGDFTHRIEVRSRDQLGELAESFNQMTGSIESLLHQAEEKRRLEEELRIAREIQMSLLPPAPATLPGLSINALCVPAREVGGDYYDFFPLGDGRLGLLVADVAGKGTSAAFYMAELKGLLLSLSRIHDSPKALLSQANRVLSDTLDSRSFITMTYAIIDVAAATLTYARAGHTPLLHYTMDGGGRRQVTTLAPDGLVLGLRIDGIAARFDQILKECTLPLRSGDVFVFYTDGISEAMNASADLFGDERLRDLVAEYGHLPVDALRARIVAEVEAFVGDADQHDDMTMILVRVDEDRVAARSDGHAPASAA